VRRQVHQALRELDAPPPGPPSRARRPGGGRKKTAGKDPAVFTDQFRYLNDQVQRFLRAGWPVISVDTKKKELVGLFKNGGQEWQPKGQPDEMNVHDFPDPTLGKAIPSGICDVTRNGAWVSVGHDQDTAAFAVESVRRWWANDGRTAYPRTGSDWNSACG